ncbi:hypothetical protein COO60DRAFT_1554680 [Scenedesmus sp. NREL 46B-D3]|nr:hypothetical protein COO60DRAFT_1554680 [Scenedesmus sp. NREL 46B-D3]
MEAARPGQPGAGRALDNVSVIPGVLHVAAQAQERAPTEAQARDQEAQGHTVPLVALLYGVVLATAQRAPRAHARLVGKVLLTVRDQRWQAGHGRCHIQCLAAAAQVQRPGLVEGLAQGGTQRTHSTAVLVVPVLVQVVVASLRKPKHVLGSMCHHVALDARWAAAAVQDGILDVDALEVQRRLVCGLPGALREEVAEPLQALEHLLHGRHCCLLCHGCINRGATLLRGSSFPDSRRLLCHCLHALLSLCYASRSGSSRGYSSSSRGSGSSQRLQCNL